MTDFSRFMVIKTAWCDSYTGDDPVGNFAYLDDGGIGAERYNMRRTKNGFEVYCMPPAPQPAVREGWTIAHVARDPAEQRMKLVGWYEDGSFLGDYRPRDVIDETAVYCIRAARAFEIPMADRPIVIHDHKLGTTRLGWLRGQDSSTDWSRVSDRLQRQIEAVRGLALDQSASNLPDVRSRIGDTRQAIADSIGLQADDDGTPYGRSSGESEEHHRLRLWAQDNPVVFTMGKAVQSFTEYPLLSGDRVDAAHISNDGIWLVEAKSRRSGEKDIERGIYQCVKYKAVAEAMQKGQRDCPEVEAILLTENRLSDRMQALAKRHGIRHLVHHCGN